MNMLFKLLLAGLMIIAISACTSKKSKDDIQGVEQTMEVVEDEIELEVDDESAAEDSEDAVTEYAEEKRMEVAAPIKKFKNGLHFLSRDCVMREDASKDSAAIKTLRQGKKLWMDNHDKKWVKVYRKAGVAYIDKNCL